MKKLIKTKQKLVTYSMLLSLSLVILMLGLVGYAFSWFINNEDVDTNFNPSTTKGVNVTFELSYDGQNWSSQTNQISFGSIFAGDINKKTLYVRTSLSSNQNLNVSLYLNGVDNNSSKENPYIYDGLYYYFGSQIQIFDVRVTVDNQNIDASNLAVGKGEYLVKTSSSAVEKGQNTGVNAAVGNILPLKIVNGYELNANTPTIFEIDFVFVDNGEDQNIYQNYENFNCSRTILFGW